MIRFVGSTLLKEMTEQLVEPASPAYAPTSPTPNDPPASPVVPAHEWNNIHKPHDEQQCIHCFIFRDDWVRKATDCFRLTNPRAQEAMWRYRYEVKQGQRKRKEAWGMLPERVQAVNKARKALENARDIARNRKTRRDNARDKLLNHSAFDDTKEEQLAYAQACKMHEKAKDNVIDKRYDLEKAQDEYYRATRELVRRCCLGKGCGYCASCEEINHQCTAQCHNLCGKEGSQYCINYWCNPNDEE